MLPLRSLSLTAALCVVGLGPASGCKGADHEPPSSKAEVDPVAAAPEGSADTDALDRHRAHARALTKAFAKELEGSLVAGIEAGGPAAAIEVCKRDAPAIAAKQSDQGWTLSRTAPRVRNPANAPTPWQAEVLADWAAKLAAGEVEDPATLEWATILETEAEGAEFRYMRAIPMGGLCLSCHGPADQLEATVRDALAQHYPEDRATGFAVGQLRGAFVVTAKL